jgi:hypothetical protein
MVARALTCIGTSPTVQNVTLIAGPGEIVAGLFTDSGAAPSLKHARIHASGTGAYAVWMGVASGALNLTDTSIVSGTNLFLTRGVWNQSTSAVTLDEVTISSGAGAFATGWAVYSGGPVVVRDSVLAAPIFPGPGPAHAYGIETNGGAGVTIQRSEILGGSSSLLLNGTASSFVAASQLDGPVTGSGPRNCVGVYNGVFVFFPNTCP